MVDESIAQQLDAIRRNVGVSRPMWLQLLNVESDAAANRDPEILSRARDVQRSHRHFTRKMIRRIDEEFAKPAVVIDETPYISTAQVSAALGLGEFHVCALRDRGKLKAHRDNRRILYSREAIVELIESPVSPRQQHAPLAPKFVEYVLN